MINDFDNLRQYEVIRTMLEFPEKVIEVKADYFQNQLLSNAFSKIKEQQDKNPNGEMYTWIQPLDREIKIICLEIMQNTLLIAGTEDALINNFIEEGQQRLLNKAMSELSISNSTISEYQKVIDDFSTGNIKEKDTQIEYIEKFNDDEEEKRIPTGFSQIDKMIGGGIPCTALTIIGARPSVGKTTFALNIAANNPKLRIKFFSLEMTSKMIYDRLMADRCNIDYAKTSKHQLLSDDEKVKILVKLDDYPNLNVIDDIYSIEQILSKTSKDVDLVIIDYVQIVETMMSFREPRFEINYISRRIKQFVKRTNIPVILLSQITRAGKDEPTMSDLKESGALEQDGDIIMVLHRPYVNDKESKKYAPNEATVKIDKNKFGETKVIKMNFSGKYQRFTEIEERYGN